MTDDLNDMDDAKALAGELALRVLSPAEEAAARAREAGDPAFAAEVETWNEHLAGMATDIPAVAPSPAVWPRVESAILPAANDNGRTQFWRRWAIGSTGLLAASVAAMAMMLAQPDPVITPAVAPPVGVTRVATLQLDGNGAAAMTIAYDSATGNLYLAPTDKMAGDTRVPHLWLVLPNEEGVQLIGAIDGSAATHQRLTDALSGIVGTATAVAVSMEAPGHTPDIHKPDGPVVASGALQQL